MVDVRELRIGNLVYVIDNYETRKTGITTVFSIESEEEECINRERYSWGETYQIYYPENIEPIPLTEEWMIKLGFEFKGYEHDPIIPPPQGWCIGRLCFDKNLYRGASGRYDGFTKQYALARVTKLNTVHGMQNYYFALTGQELTLKQ